MKWQWKWGAALLLLLAALTLVGCRASTELDRPQMLFFWSATCHFCEELMPTVRELEREYGRRVEFVYVSQDEEEGRDVARQYGVVGTPTLLFLDRRGETVQVLRGVPLRPVLVQALEDLLAADARLDD